MNSLTLGDSDLVPVDYGDLLDKILEVLQGKNPFSVSEDNRRLLIDIDAIAADVSRKQVRQPLGSFEPQADSATVNLPPEIEEHFGSQVKEIREFLRQHLELKLPPNTSIESFVANLISPLDSPSFRGNGKELGFKYDFDTRHPSLEKERLTLESRGTGSHAALKLHKLTVTVRNTDIFAQELKQGLQNYINENADTSSEKEDLNHRLDEIVKNPDSDFHKLIRLVDKETLGKIQKEAKITYLEYLLEHIRASSTDTVGIIYLEDLIRRLRLIEEYINDPTKSDGEYEVNYAGVRVNYRDIFARSEFLDALPIIPIVSGYLGESTDNSRNERKFIFGLKIKFDNSVQARGGKDVFEYYLNLLNPDSEEHQAEFDEDSNPETFVRKLLKIALLYYFVLASRNNPLAQNYDPESELNHQPKAIFEQRVLPVLQGSNDEDKKELFRNFIKGLNQFNIKHKITHLRKMLRGFLERQTILPTRTETRHVNLKIGLVEDIDNILTNGKFFNEIMERNYKQTLHYITVKEPSVDEKSICQLPVNISIEDVRYFPTDERQNFSMEYNIKDVDILPVASVPESRMSAYNNFFKQYKLLLFRYNNRRLDSGDTGLQPAAAFVYKFTMLLLSYICLRILLENTADNLFIPMVRLHEGDHNHPSPSEVFMANLSKTLSHILSEKQRSTSQGFRIKKTPNGFTIRNGLSSLYSILPKKFRFNDNVLLAPELDKLAIIVVSSRDSDAKRSNQNRFQRQASLIGEIVGINRLDDSTIQVEMLKTLSENYSVSRLYSEPLILEDVMSQLYQQGYRNFAYISQAPYMSTLHITQTEEDEELSFMSKKLLRTLKGERRDIKIYPIFFDKYYVRSFLGDKGKSFYIQDAMELESLFADTSQQAVMFFNLFNGIRVREEKNFYNGVISYSTLLNIYQGILDDQDIREGLIYDGAIKNTLLHYLTIFHFSRYEARHNISLKLDPYERIIGDESVGALSIFSHGRGSADFNSLAFLNKVREVLNVDNGGINHDW
ncbi:hypothetical protein Osc7112_3550 [Oscillatoria nigro-viridis PCC 7112]|uniref:Uncharacterized protein n=1 Tax=Phormidium nigroviride PCC 7112 TaxID=179408 RepID=K9VIX6_9CYAN|nr:hypothetical protein [Oscillatoria nigro-viridis]AFZ07916.1 hypothetical protein Osc7112_3550 [Oscillatoria nigro-viridis PCC 7112]